jgi:hypothetical protein
MPGQQRGPPVTQVVSLCAQVLGYGCDMQERSTQHDGEGWLPPDASSALPCSCQGRSLVLLTVTLALPVPGLGLCLQEDFAFALPLLPPQDSSQGCWFQRAACFGVFDGVCSDGGSKWIASMSSPCSRHVGLGACLLLEARQVFHCVCQHLLVLGACCCVRAWWP